MQVRRQIAWRDDRRVARLLEPARIKMSKACIKEIECRACSGR
jgi:hypothetical protein